MKKILFLILLISFDASARVRDTRDTSLYGGFGFGYSDASLQLEGQEQSDFSGWNGALELGVNWTLNSPFGINLAAEYLTSDMDNSLDSPTYMEKADVNATNLKLGLYWGNFTIGVGVSETKIKVKNVSSTSAGETSSFSGDADMYFVNYGFENNHLRAVVEAQYSTGVFEELKYEGMSFGVRIFYLFSK